MYMNSVEQKARFSKESLSSVAFVSEKVSAHQGLFLRGVHFGAEISRK
jgi:hypothetical protein